MFKRLAVAALAVAGSVGSAQAVVISDTQILLSPTTQHGANYAITAIQSPVENDPTSMWFSKVDSAGKSTLTAITWNVDQGSDYYLAQAGQVLTAQTVASGQFTLLAASGSGRSSVQVPLPGDFYLAVATTTAGPVFSTQRDAWGWVHLRNDASGLSILGSAMAYGEGGIIVGSVTAVPEPGTGVLMLGGLVLLGSAARQRAQARART